jgi:hypothetical protein
VTRPPVTLHLKGLKINTLVPPDALPADLVPPEPAPAGDPVVDLALEGSDLIVRARLNGKSVRKALKAIAAQGAGNVHVLLQGTLKPPAAAGGPYVLDSAGLSVSPRGGPPASPP